MAGQKKLLLHTCCGTCGAWVPKMLAADFAVTLFYFNPNIHPAAEYQRRLADAKLAARQLGVELIERDYEPAKWFAAVKGLANEPEGGRRCAACFEHRMRETAKYAKEHGFDLFATTLTVGRNKKAAVIDPIGQRLAGEYGVDFLPGDFKKKGGQEQSLKLSDQYGIVRQNYCGCVYSKR